MFIIVFGIWVIWVANLGAMDDRDLTVEGYYRNEYVLTESIVMCIILFGIWVMRVANLKAFNCIAWYLLVLHCIIVNFGRWAVSRKAPTYLFRDIVWYCMVLNCSIQNFIVFHCTALYCMVLHGFALYCMALFVWLCAPSLIFGMLSFGGFLAECLPCLSKITNIFYICINWKIYCPPKLQRRGACI